MIQVRNNIDNKFDPDTGILSEWDYKFSKGVKWGYIIAQVKQQLFWIDKIEELCNKILIKQRVDDTNRF